MRNALIVFALLLSPLAAQAAPITGWLVHNGTASIDNTDPNNPAITGTPKGSSDTFMAPFSSVTLANDGDYVEVKTTLTMTGRDSSVVSAASLNTQLRLGLFDSTNSSLSANDFPNLGFTIEYSNSNASNRAMLREQTSATQTNPFTSPTLINNPTAPSGQIEGANPGPVTFDIKLTRDAGKLDITGSIVGTDAGNSNAAYEEDFSQLGYTSSDFQLNGPFTFNRIGLFFGANAAPTSSTLSSSQVLTNTPEPASFALLAGLTGLFAINRRSRKAAH